MSALQPLLLNARDTGGAATASKRILMGLRELGLDGKLLVRQRSTDQPGVIGPSTRRGKVLARLRPHLDRVPLRFYDPADEYSLDWVPDRLRRRVGDLNPDVVHLNWVAGGFMDIKTLGRLDYPLVWRLPDMWPMTGGCHYSGDCTRYRETCGSCPRLGSHRERDPSRYTLWRKRRALADTDLTIVATTDWLADHAAESTLFGDRRIEVIPNGLDTTLFRPVDPSVGRDLFGLPDGVPLVLFGSVGPLSNRRKGFDLLQGALDHLAETDLDAELVVFGTGKPEDGPSFDFPTHYTGYLEDEQSLALLYAAADVMVVPSRYEGFGQTVTEAMACGTPVVAFEASGPAETVVDGETGYLAEPYDPDDFARGIRTCLAADDLGDAARERAVDRYHYTDIAEQYRDLYREITDTGEF